MLGSSSDLAPGADTAAAPSGAGGRGGAGRTRGRTEGRKDGAQSLLLLSLYPRGILNWAKAERTPLRLYGEGGVPCRLLTALAFPLRKA